MNESTYDTHLYKLSEEISNTEIDLNKLKSIGNPC